MIQRHSISLTEPVLEWDDDTPSLAEYLVGTRPKWFARAACKGQTELFFPGRGEHDKTGEAKAICVTCPVKPQCREHSLDHVVQGIWGGLSEKQRRRIRSTRRAAS